MACSITSGFTLGCRDSIGGIDSIFILSGSISGITEANGLISDIAGSGTFFEFQLPKQVGDFTETPNTSIENGTVFYEQVVNVAFHKLQASIRNQVELLAKNPDLKIVVKTNNGLTDYSGQFFLLGRHRGLALSGGSGASGTAFGDLNGYSLTFTGQEPVPMFEIDASGDLSNALTTITVG